MPARQTSSESSLPNLDEGTAGISQLASDITRMTIERGLSYEGSSAALVIARCLYDRSKDPVVRLTMQPAATDLSAPLTVEQLDLAESLLEFGGVIDFPAGGSCLLAASNGDAA